MLFTVLYTLTAIIYAVTALYVRQICGMWRLFCHFSAIHLATFSFACQSTQFTVNLQYDLHAKLFVRQRLGMSVIGLVRAVNLHLHV